jgi:L-cysteine/cystine lyase
MTAERWAELRADIPALEHYTYLNTGFAPPPSRAMTDAIRARLDFELEHGTTTRIAMDEARAMKERLRAGFARVLGADTHEVALTASTGVGVSIVLAGLALEAGDHLVTSSVEHGSGVVPLYHAGRMSQVEVDFVAVSPDDSHGEITERFVSAITERTSVVMISEIAYATGQLLPVRAITEAAHRVGAIVVIDGAQTGGHIPIDVRALGVDAYAIPAQKWLCGPRGIGALYVSPEALRRISPSIVDVSHAAEWDHEGGFEPKADVPGKYELAAVPPVLVAGAVQAVESYLESGPEAVFERVRELNRAAEARFSGIEGVTIDSPRTEESRTGLFCFGAEGLQASDLVPWMQSEHHVVARAVRERNVARLSLHVFNNEDDIERAATAVEQALRDGVPQAPAPH